MIGNFLPTQLRLATGYFSDITDPLTTSTMDQGHTSNDAYRFLYPAGSDPETYDPLYTLKDSKKDL